MKNNLKALTGFWREQPPGSHFSPPQNLSSPLFSFFNPSIHTIILQLYRHAVLGNHFWSYFVAWQVACFASLPFSPRLSSRSLLAAWKDRARHTPAVLELHNKTHSYEFLSEFFYPFSID